MPSPYDACPDRANTWSEKWDRWAGKDILPMWVADMDLQAPPCVIEALQRRLAHGVLGYTHCPPEFAEALCAWMRLRHGWEPHPDWVLPAPGMVVAMNTAARALGKPGDDGLVMTPIYPPFLRAPGLAERNCVRVALLDTSDGWRIDWDALALAATPKASVLWLCSPHNPTGRVWTRAELERLAQFALSHNMHIISDEAHLDLVLEPGLRHIPTASLSAEVAARTITILAPSKTFNIPGLSSAAVIIPNAELRRAYKDAQLGLVPWTNVMGIEATIAAWRGAGPWLDGLVTHLRANRDTAHSAVANLTGLRSHRPESTYLTWIDCRARGWHDPAAVCERAGLGLSDGRSFGAAGWMRLNFGCTSHTLAEGLRRLVSIDNPAT